MEEIIKIKVIQTRIEIVIIIFDKILICNSDNEKSKYIFGYIMPYVTNVSELTLLFN